MVFILMLAWVAGRDVAVEALANRGSRTLLEVVGHRGGAARDRLRARPRAAEAGEAMMRTADITTEADDEDEYEEDRCCDDRSNKWNSSTWCGCQR
jgi:hypothetical protein